MRKNSDPDSLIHPIQIRLGSLLILSFFFLLPQFSWGQLEDIPYEDESSRTEPTPVRNSDTQGVTETPALEIPVPEGRKTYLSERYGFRLETPNPDWKILDTTDELEALNPNASVIFLSPDGLCTMVLVERLPWVPLEEFAGALKPGVQNPSLLSEESTTIADLPAIRRFWQGKEDDQYYQFYYLILAYQDLRIQIVSWCSADLITPELEKKIIELENSFQVLGTYIAPPTETPTSEPTESPTTTPIETPTPVGTPRTP